MVGEGGRKRGEWVLGPVRIPKLGVSVFYCQNLLGEAEIIQYRLCITILAVRCLETVLF
jgi:hypothetical protein